MLAWGRAKSAPFSRIGQSIAADLRLKCRRQLSLKTNMPPKDKLKLQLVNLIIVDVALILFVTWLISRGIVPLYPAAAIAYPILLATNVLWVWARNRRRVKSPIVRRSIPLSLWIVVAIFTLAGIAGIVAYLRSPSMPLGVQAAVAVLLVGYLWFLVYRLGRSRHNQVPI